MRPWGFLIAGAVALGAISHASEAQAQDQPPAARPANGAEQNAADAKPFSLLDQYGIVRMPRAAEPPIEAPDLSDVDIAVPLEEPLRTRQTVPVQGVILVNPPGAEPEPTPPAIEQPPQTAEAAEPTPSADQRPYETHGEFEAGARVFLRRPPRRDRAKFEEYTQIAPGPFLENFYYGVLAKDGSLLVDFWTNHTGYEDQRYRLEVARPGVVYLSGEWDQTPHRLSTSARTVFDNSDPARLSVIDALVADKDEINDRARPIDLEVQRRTGKAEARFTPKPGWEFKVNYSDESRAGTRALGTTRINGGGAPRFDAIEVLEPIFYRTENVGALAQYLGTYVPGKTWLVSVGYDRSQFWNRFDTLIWEDPFNTSHFVTNSLPPSNQSGQVTATLASDLPFFDSRYVGTVSKGEMTQDGRLVLVDPGDVSAIRPTARIATLMHNHTLSSRLRDDVSSTLSYRFHSVDYLNPLDLNALGDIGEGPPPLPPSFTRRRANWDLKWRVKPWVTLGSKLNWERYDWEHMEVKVTDEFGGTLFADAKPQDSIRINASYSEHRRRADDYQQIVENQNELMRKFSLSDRDRSTARIMATIALNDSLTVAPSFNWRHDRFGDQQPTGPQLGLKDEIVWGAGIEVMWAVNERVSIMTSYMREDLQRKTVNREDEDASSAWASSINDVVHTFISTLNVALIANTLDLRLSHAYSTTGSKTDTFALGSAGVISSPQFPLVTNNFHRLNALLAYRPSADIVKRLGLRGEVTAKLGYTYERNAMTNWQIDNMKPFMAAVDPDANESLFLAWINPNYETHIVTTSLSMKW